MEELILPNRLPDIEELIILPRPDVNIPGWYEPNSGNSDPADDIFVNDTDVDFTKTLHNTTETAVNNLDTFIKRNYVLLTVLQWILLIILLFKISKIK